MVVMCIIVAAYTVNTAYYCIYSLGQPLPKMNNTGISNVLNNISSFIIYNMPKYQDIVVFLMYN